MPDNHVPEALTLLPHSTTGNHNQAADRYAIQQRQPPTAWSVLSSPVASLPEATESLKVDLRFDS